MPFKTFFFLLLCCNGLIYQTGAQTAPEPNFHVYLLLGQSNMAGRGAITETYKNEHHARVWMLNKAGEWVQAQHPLHFDKPQVVGVGPGLAFGIRMAEAGPAVNIGLVPCAVGGTAIKRWQPGAYDSATKTHPYDDALLRIKAAMKRGIVKGVIWHQGESNAAHPEGYLDKLVILIERIRKEVGNPRLPFVAGELGLYRPAYENISSEIRKLPGLVPFTAVATTEGLVHKGDTTHFDSPSATLLGERYAAQMEKLERAGTTQPGYGHKYGNWEWSSKALPVYHYTGALPVTAFDKGGKDANLPEDPYFLLGNYRMALITHASGIYQFLTAERAWARINAGEQTNYGWNDASIAFTNQPEKKRVLTGLSSMAADAAATQKYFGVGFARYTYQLEKGLSCTRILSTRPSLQINTGSPAFVVTVVLQNTGTSEQQLVYTERMGVNFVLNSTQYTEKQKRPLLYSTHISINNTNQLALAALSYKTNAFLVLPKKTERFWFDLDPPSPFMYLKDGSRAHNAAVRSDNDTLAAAINLTVKPGETVSFHIVIGLTHQKNFSAVQKEADTLLAGADLAHPLEGLYAALWKNKLPDLSAEKDDTLRREMLWNAHVVEASAKYSAYYGETIIPQGTVYSYYFGDNISNRDHLQAALPACYTNPALARSIIRYVIKHAEGDGEIKRGNSGFGYTPPSLYKESDEQLYFFNTLAEYLLITKDYSFLNEKVAYYPAEAGKADPVLTLLKKFFIYLRDEIGTGPNGLVKMLNSDWSDSFFHDYSPNRYAGSAESHLNSAMVLAIFPKLEQVLKASGNREAGSLITSLEEYRQSVEKAFMKDLGSRKFSARAYLSPQLRFGTDNVCIEPQGYLLQIPGLAAERKKEIYDVVKSKLLTPEKIGIRTREKPLWKGNPEGEDGGVWFSLEYPLLLGVASFDRDEARRLLKKFSFQNFTDNYPDYWVGQWTAADEVNSTLYREGLYAFWVPSQDRKHAFQGYCSHPHTWPLFCYFKLQQ